MQAMMASSMGAGAGAAGNPLAAAAAGGGGDAAGLAALMGGGAGGPPGGTDAMAAMAKNPAMVEASMKMMRNMDEDMLVQVRAWLRH